MSLTTRVDGRVLRLLGTGLLGFGALSCAAGSSLQARVEVLEGRVKAAYKPAYKCEEKALAVAESNLAFAHQELSEGDSFRARDHVDEAESATRVAETAVPRPECHEDTDGDGLYDPIDKCPTEPEDLDGFEDDDGCPEDQDTDGDGLLDSVDHCPREPEDKDGFQDEDGCPDPDNDGDGILDGVDKCPNQAEDFDQFEDTDGCPDPDNDADGILDVNDKCPNEPEDFDGDADEDGCPDLFKRIVMRDDRIELKQKVFFATNKSVIKSNSFELLDEVAQALQVASKIRVRIEGHTDSQGSDKKNLKLSQDRANSVKTYLMNKGVDPGRMEAIGYGETTPIEDNRTAIGREANRRVEFNIIK